MSNEKIKPILHYDFEHFTEDGKVQDMSGNGYHGTIVGATRTEDMWGNPNSAMMFDTYTDMISAQNPKPHSMSVLLEANPHNMYNYLPLITTCSASSGFHLFSHSSSGTIGMLIKTPSSSSIYNTGISIPLNRSSIFGFTFDNEYLNILLNGDIIYSASQVGNIIYEPDIFGKTDQIYIGHGFYGSTFIGEFDEVRMYNQALTPTQVKKISFDMMRKIWRQ